MRVTTFLFLFVCSLPLVAGCTEQEGSAEKAAAEGNHAKAEPAVEVVEIPLEKMWAWNMLDIPDVRQLEPENDTQLLPGETWQEAHKRLVSTDVQRIRDLLRSKVPLGSGFAVAGEGQDALTAVKEFLEKPSPRAQRFSADENITLFFAATRLQGLCSIKKVERRNSAILLSCDPPVVAANFALTRSRSCFALIPLGKLPPGIYETKVSFLQIRNRASEQLGFEYVAENIDGKVSTDFHFEVVE